jgi:mutator protein MutT
MKTIDVACGILFNEDGHVLIGLRSTQVFLGMWEFPGGKLEKNENASEAVIREFREELDVKVGVCRHFCDCQFKHKGTIINLSAFIVCLSKDDKKFNPSSHMMVKFVGLKDLLSYHLLPPDMEIAEKLIEVMITHNLSSDDG